MDAKTPPNEISHPPDGHPPLTTKPTDFFYQITKQDLNANERWRTQQNQQLNQRRLALITRWGSAQLNTHFINVEYRRHDTIRITNDYDTNTQTVSFLVSNRSPNMHKVKQTLKQLYPGMSLHQAIVRQMPVTYSMHDEFHERSSIIDNAQNQLNEIDMEAAQLIRAHTDLPGETIYQLTHTKKMRLLVATKRRINQIKQLYQLQRLSIDEDHPDKKIISYTIPLLNDTLHQRAMHFYPQVRKASKKWQVSPSLLMAIIHTESAFNPRAESPLPAFGLMQIRPTSIGRDVNLRIHHVDKLMPPQALYQPENNIDIGAAYLSLLSHQYLSAITNTRSRLYCTIVAYHSGISNIVRTFNPSSSLDIHPAEKIINGLTPEQVYHRLLHHLPYEASRQYLKNVRERLILYPKI